MNKQINVIAIRKTAVEYRLTIPFEEKHRAKKIPGWGWNGKDKEWVYPRNKATYGALMNEFAKDLQNLKITSPAPAAIITQTAPAQAQNVELREQLESMRQQVAVLADAVANAKSDSEKIDTLREKSKKQESTITDLEAALDAERTETNQLRDEHELLLEKLANPQNTGYDNAEDAVKELAIASAGNDKRLKKTLNSFEITSKTPMEISSQVEKQFRNILNNKSRETNFANLINEANIERGGTVHKDVCDIAHAIRQQHNLCAHPGPHTIGAENDRMRTIFCIAAYTLFWHYHNKTK